jgi:hypothetical protein
MQYIKHYWIGVNSENYEVNENPIEKRHPEAEFPGLDVKLWLHDIDGIDVCLSQVPDNITIDNVIIDDKKAVIKLTEDQFNDVCNIIEESNMLSYRASLDENEELREDLINQSKLKYQEGIELLHSF